MVKKKLQMLKSNKKDDDDDEKACASVFIYIISYRMKGVWLNNGGKTFIESDKNGMKCNEE